MSAADIVAYFVIVAVMAIDLWGVFCGLDVMRILRKSRRIAPILNGLFNSARFMSLNAAFWFMILAELVILPRTATDPNAQAWEQAITITLFFGASLCITLALHSLRKLLLADPAVRTIGS